MDNSKEIKQELEKVYHLISYEFGSPVNSLKVMADLVMTDAVATGNGLIAESARYMYSQVEQLQQRLRNLIFWADLNVKNYTFKPVGVNVDLVLTKLITDFTDIAGLKGILIIPYAPQGLLVNADLPMLTLLLQNILSNAVKFSRKGDTIEVTAHRLPAADSVQVTVRDTGVGMGPAKLAAVFNPSRRNTGRGTANEPGLGLGLVVAQAILTLHGHTLQLISEPNLGTTVIIELPTATAS